MLRMIYLSPGAIGYQPEVPPKQTEFCCKPPASPLKIKAKGPLVVATWRNAANGYLGTGYRRKSHDPSPLLAYCTSTGWVPAFVGRAPTVSYESEADICIATMAVTLGQKRTFTCSGHWPSVLSFHPLK